MFPLDATEIALACIITVMAGFVKGAVGFAMPLIMISLIGSFADPRVALGLLVLPTLLSNLLQVWNVGWAEARQALRDHGRYVAIVGAAIFVSAQAVTAMPERAMLLVMGIPVVILSLVQLLGLRFTIPPGRRALADWGIGLLAGALGGISGVWGPPTVLYLLALDTPKGRQMAVQGVVYGAGSVVLLLAHLRSGVFDAAVAPLSALLVVPAFLGMGIGFALGRRMDQILFRRATLVVLTVAGLNLVRRALF